MMLYCCIFTVQVIASLPSSTASSLKDEWKHVFSACSQSHAWGGHCEDQSICLGSAAIPCSAVSSPHNCGQTPLPPWGLGARQHTWACAKATGLRVVKYTWPHPAKTQLPAELRGVQASEKVVAKPGFQVRKCQEWGFGTGGAHSASQLCFTALCNVPCCALPVPGLASCSCSSKAAT